LPESVKRSLILLYQGKRVDEIAQVRDLKISTIYDHLAQAIEEGVLDLAQIPDITPQIYAEICTVWQNLNDEDKKRLKPTYEILEGRYGYGVLRCVLSFFQRESTQ
jgi:ATP-dependent DNA helicase RecQ